MEQDPAAVSALLRPPPSNWLTRRRRAGRAVAAARPAQRRRPLRRRGLRPLHDARPSPPSLRRQRASGGLRPPHSGPAQSGSSCADSGSRWTVAWALVRSADAGHDVATAPSARRTGSALRASGTTASTRPARSRAGMVTVMAWAGTASSAAKWPSSPVAAGRRPRARPPSRRAVVEVGDRRVVEGQVAVLPDAEAAQVERVGPQQPGVAGHSASASPRPSTSRRPRPRRSTMRSRIQRWNPAGWSGPTPTYSSMWKTTVSDQGTPSVSSTSACDERELRVPVANIAWATPRAPRQPA